MEKKQLNLNAPLLSMRKTASNFLGASNKQNNKIEKLGPLRQRSLPMNHQPRWELSEVSKPGTIPFLWEQMPGRPKENLSGETESQKRSSSTPRLPPGWGADGSRRNSGERHIGYNTHKSSFEAYHLTDHAALIESLRASMYDNGIHDLEDENDAYSNAADTLSLEGSMSINCSVSGVSNLDVSSRMQSSNIEKQTKDLMMSRFLPAAKAVALETPQYVPKNKYAVSEQPKQVKKAILVERNPLLENKSRSNLILSDYQYAEDNAARDAAEDDNKRDERSKRSGKAWGFLPRIVPRLCVKKTLSMLNPVPGLKTKTPTPKSPANDISRLTRKAYSGPLDKPTLDRNNRKKFHSGALSGELRRMERKMGETNQFSYSNAAYKPGGLSPFRTAGSAGVSPYRNATPLSPFDKGSRFLSKPKEVESPLSATSSPFLRKKQLVSANHIVEKVVPVDSDYLKPVKPTNLDKFSESRKEENSPPTDMDCVSKLSDRMEDEQLDQGINNASSAIVRSPLPPPLPKSPSESWLWKTVPSIPFRNPFSHSNNANAFHSNKAGVKWETIVKKSNLHHTHNRYSEELVPHISH